MDLSAWLLRHTPPRPFVVALRGGTGARLAVERVVRERGWRTATSPAEANVLVVTGPVGHMAQPYVERVWDLVPAPRARADVRDAVTAERELDAAERALGDVDRQRHDAARAGRDDQPEPAEPAHQHDEEHGGHTHGHHGHDMDGMTMPGNVPMADRAEDRDGLMLDRLRVPLGPLLPDWPSGLIVRTTLQGDVVQQATVEVLGDPEPFWPHAEHTARRLDSCARLLRVAGWTDASMVARRLRDGVLDGALTTTAPLARWTRRVRRSHTLRWSLAGVGVVAPDAPATPAELRGDALARLERWLEPEASPETARTTQWTVDHLPALLEGSELATARLIVASLDPDLDLLARREVARG